ncbi:muconate/chloromuconate family cycloisomerase [Pusillimonas sp. MFBS29]|uniref:muconate/chloromuconate family cycloisomerase n=1 Tax=Pusillimonas sp. MFBS29 TaxID=2886690 RepID=UPI00272E76A2|nr:muconate/chloromuconate family cycloisomerase [Pusillimonas sp. MFBS29]
MQNQLSPMIARDSVKIERVETLLLDLPTIRPHQLSMATMNGQTLMLVRIYCSDGTVGIGEGTTIGGLAYGAESPEGMKLAIDTYFAPVLIGADANRVQALMARLDQGIRDNRFAKCAVETALYDALGHRTGLPVSELLGGRLRDSLPVAWTLASGDTAKDIAEAEAMLAQQRHRIFKLKIGKRAVADDVAHVAAIKKALGDRAAVRVDVNMAWSEFDARYGLAGLADAGCELAEQPVASAEALARLTGKHAIAVMADESLVGPASAFALARAGAADVFAIKIEQSGGLQAAQRVAAIADAANIQLYGGTMLEGAVGTMASAHVFSTFRELHWGTELFGPLLLTEEILQEPLSYQNFELALPTTPGLGIALDEERVQFFRRDK